MTTQGQRRFERVLAGLFDELADARTPDYLEAAIERASSRPQRPAWTYPKRWLPMDISARAVPTVPLPWRQLGVLMLIIILLAATIAVYVGSQLRRLPEPFGPAGNGVIALAKDGDIFVADRPGGGLRPLVAGPEFDQEPMFSPDGTKLAFMRGIDDRLSESVLMVADADGTNIVQVTPDSLKGGWKWSFAPGGRSVMGVARIDGENRVVLFPVDPGAAATVLDIRLPASGMAIEAPGFRPTNPQEILVVAQLVPDGPPGLYVYDLGTGGLRTIVERADTDHFSFGNVAWLPDGEHIMYSGRIVAADGSGDQALDALEGDQQSPVSNDGTRIVAGSMVVPIDGEGKHVDLACGSGTNIECAEPWIWSPDDSILIGHPYVETSTYLVADPDTGEVTELDWVDVGTPAWQRVAR